MEFTIRPLVDDAGNSKELEWEVGNRRGDEETRRRGEGVQRWRKMRSGAPTRLCRVEKPEWTRKVWCEPAVRFPPPPNNDGERRQ